MVDKSGVDAAIAGLNGKEIDGRTLVVNEAQPRQARPSGSGSGGGGGSGGGSHDRPPARGAGSASRQAPYTGPPPGGRGGSFGGSAGRGGGGGGGEYGERAPKSGKPGSREKDRDKQKFDPDDDW
jgi:RNA recognition motif-containing protein